MTASCHGLVMYMCLHVLSLMAVSLQNVPSRRYGKLVSPVYYGHFIPTPLNHITNSLAGWWNINMLNNLMKVHVHVHAHTHACAARLHAASPPARIRVHRYAYITLKYHLINGQTALMRTHLHLIIITLLRFSNQLLFSIWIRALQSPADLFYKTAIKCAPNEHMPKIK